MGCHQFMTTFSKGEEGVVDRGVAWHGKCPRAQWPPHVVENSSTRTTRPLFTFC